jgi:hypothetical protein
MIEALRNALMSSDRNPCSFLQQFARVGTQELAIAEINSYYDESEELGEIDRNREGLVVELVNGQRFRIKVDTMPQLRHRGR